MKSFLVLAFVAAFLWAHFAAADPDWAGVHDKIAEIQMIFIDVIQKIKQSLAGGAIGNKIDETVYKSLGVLGRAVEAVSSKNMTPHLAKSLIQEEVDIIKKLADDLKGDTALAGDIAAEITKINEVSKHADALLGN